MNDTIEAARELFTGALAKAPDVALKSKDPIVSEAIQDLIAAGTNLASASFEEGLEVGAGQVKRVGINQVNQGI